MFYEIFREKQVELVFLTNVDLAFLIKKLELYLSIISKAVFMQ